MGVNYFTDEQVEEFRKNPYVKNVSNKAITYEEKFKEYFYEQYTKGVSPTQIFRNAGFDTDLLGHKRIDGFYRRNRACTIRDEGFIDKRKGSSGRPKAKDYNNVSTAVDNGMKVIVNKITNEANKYTYSTISASKTTMEENLLKELQELFKTETIETVLINMVVQ